MSEELEKCVVRGRYAARFAAVQAIYQHDSAPQPALAIIHQFVGQRFTQKTDDVTYIKPDVDLFRTIILGVMDHQERIDGLIMQFLSTEWPFNRLDNVIKSILRCAVLELLGITEVPVPVIVNEYLNLTKDYFTEKEVAFVNGTLDSIAKFLAAQST